MNPRPDVPSACSRGSVLLLSYARPVSLRSPLSFWRLVSLSLVPGSSLRSCLLACAVALSLRSSSVAVVAAVASCSLLVQRERKAREE